MDKIKLDLDKKSINYKLEMGGKIFPELEDDPNAAVQAVGATLSNLNTSLRDKQDDKNQKEAAAIEATGVMHEEEKLWITAMKAAAAKVMEIYPNNPNKWKGFGFTLAKSTTKSTGKPAKVKKLAATTGDLIKQIDLHWDSLYNANYIIHICEGDTTIEENWKPATPSFSTKSSVTLTGLPQGKLMWFRVKGVNASGQGIWSNPVSRTIP